MAGLCWMAVTLFLLVYKGNSLPDVSQNQLEGIVTELLNRYRPSYEVRGRRKNPMFSLAVSIPYNEVEKKYDFSQVTDSGDDVRATILRCEVYTSARMVAATVLRWPNVELQCPDQPVQWDDVLKKCGRTSMTWADLKKCLDRVPDAVYEGRADHAEYRTLQHFHTLVNNLNKNDLLLFYVLASPCDQRCASLSSRWSILKSINEILRWDNYAVVFSDVFKPRGNVEIPEQERRGAIERLGTYKGKLGSIGLRNIFRCNGQNGVQCRSCSIDKQVARYCFDDTEEEGMGGGQGASGRGRGRGGGQGASGRGQGRGGGQGASGRGRGMGGGQGGSGRGWGMGGGQGASGRGWGRGGGPSLIQPQQGISDSPSQSGQGDSGKQSDNMNPSAGVSTNVDSNTGGTQSGSGGGKRRRRRRKKGKNTNEGDGVSSSVGGQGDTGEQSNSMNPSDGVSTNVDSNARGAQGGTVRGKVRKVGGRRVGKKRRGGGTKQKSGQAQRKKKKQQSRGTRQGSQDLPRRAKKQREGTQRVKQPRSRGKTQRGGGMKRINQPQQRGKKKRRG